MLSSGSRAPLLLPTPSADDVSNSEPTSRPKSISAYLSLSLSLSLSSTASLSDEKTESPQGSIPSDLSLSILSLSEKLFAACCMLAEALREDWFPLPRPCDMAGLNAPADPRPSECSLKGSENLRSKGRSCELFKSKEVPPTLMLPLRSWARLSLLNPSTPPDRDRSPYRLDCPPASTWELKELRLRPNPSPSPTCRAECGLSPRPRRAPKAP